MKIGIFGGSFNPIHLGHQKIIEYVLQQMNLDKILVVPVGKPSHRKNNLAAGEHRFHMCQLAFSHLTEVEVLDIEIRKEDISYTYDTLLDIQCKYGKKHEYFEIIGEDSLAYFYTWKNAKDILQLAKLIVLQREPYELESEDPRIILLNSPSFPISSTEIRNRLKTKKRNISWLNPKVSDYISAHKLYQTD